MKGGFAAVVCKVLSIIPIYVCICDIFSLDIYFPDINGENNIRFMFKKMSPCVCLSFFFFF